MADAWRHTDDLHVLRGGLRQLVLHLSRGQLIMVQGWVEDQLHLAKLYPSLRIVRMPDLDDAVDRGAHFAEIAGDVRRHIHALPRSSLVLLHRWVVDQLEETKR